ncbi:MAG: ribonuclease HI family protein [Candidatus Bilamarchaeaceae archaeon]
MLYVYIDGACFGNPGPMGIGVVIYKNKHKIKEISEYLGEGTNNIAEYSALIRALEEIKKFGESKALIRTDSQLLANQMSGLYKVKNHNLKILKSKADKLLQGMDVKIEHIPREHNTIADNLSKKAIAKEKS